MNREYIIAIMSIVVGIMFASAYYINIIDQNNWFTEKFVKDCNNMYGEESWTVTKIKGKYACIGNNTIRVDHPIVTGWSP